MNANDGTDGDGDWPRIVIVGAGVSGLCAAIRLKQAGYRHITVLEKAQSLGGTWRDNTYPGAACDIPSHLYSYSFAPKADWSRIYATQPEILGYLEDCAARHGVDEHIRFGVEVRGARFDRAARSWSVELADGATVVADILISACGQLHHPKMPEIEGLENFAGPVFHSAGWRHDVHIEGKRVALIGSAASAAQIGPAIARKVASLEVFQRTPNWIAPRLDRRYTAFERAALRTMPFLRRFHRATIYWTQEALFLALRRESLANRVLTRALSGFMRGRLRTEEAKQSLVPDYPMGCKRILYADDFLRMFRRPEVQLVTSRISRMEPGGIVTGDGKRHAADVIVCATGFDVSRSLLPFEIENGHGGKLSGAWSGGAEAYLGMTVPEFPNLFLLYGPNTGLGHNSIIFMVERQVGYLIDIVGNMRKSGAREITVSEKVTSRFESRIGERLKTMTWSAGCASWYRDEHGRVVTNWPYSTTRYWWETRKSRRSDYEMS